MAAAPNIIFVGNFLFPDGNAAGLNMLGVGKALREAGFDVLFAGMEERERSEDVQADGTYAYQGFPYVSAHNECGTGAIARKKYALQTLWLGSTTLARLKSIDARNLSAVIAYNSSTFLLRRLRAFCRKHGAALITYTSEWHTAAEFPRGRWDAAYLDMEIRIRWMVPKIGHAIAISEYLHRYYQSRGCHTIRIPTLIDTGEGSPMLGRGDIATDDDRNVLKLLFTGSAQRERWDVILAAIQQVRRSGRNVRLDVFGYSRDGFLSVLGSSGSLAEQLGDSLVVRGRVPREEYLAGIANSDFLVMLRDDTRGTRACFPTKMADLMAMGTPVITNMHSDLGLFLRDGVESLIVHKPVVPDFAETLERAARMPPEDIQRMKRNARQRAEECFDYRRYVEPLKKFLEESRARCR